MDGRRWRRQAGGLRLAVPAPLTKVPTFSRFALTVAVRVGSGVVLGTSRHQDGNADMGPGKAPPQARPRRSRGSEIPGKPAPSPGSATARRSAEHAEAE